jgi:hypothetical protein
MTSRTFPIDLLQADLAAIVSALDSGLFTSEQLVQEYHRQCSVLPECAFNLTVCRPNQ